MMGRRVLKIGGSLLRGTAWRGVMAALAQSAPGPLVIVPGGGVYADAVRSTQAALGFDDAVAHEMAVLAMAQTACVLHGACPRAVRASTVAGIEAAWQTQDLVIWQPTVLPDTPADGRHWEFTSDSLAAWLALRVQADELGLLKSCELPEPASTAPGDSQARAVWLAWSQAGLVDRCFADQTARLKGRVSLLTVGELPTWLSAARPASPGTAAQVEQRPPRPALYEASVPVLLRYLVRLEALVDIARTHSGGDANMEAALMIARLADDMLPWPTQVLVAAQMARRAAFPLAGRAVPAYPGEARDLPELAAKVRAIRNDLLALRPSEFIGAEERVIAERAGEAELRLPAAIFLGEFVLPNFFFHLGMAYAILRRQGVPVGKADFDGWHRYPSSALGV